MDNVKSGLSLRIVCHAFTISQIASVYDGTLCVVRYLKVKFFLILVLNDYVFIGGLRIKRQLNNDMSIPPEIKSQILLNEVSF